MSTQSFTAICWIAAKAQRGSDITKQKPFFKEYSLTGSGHPSGFTYGWVAHDDKDLQVYLDFTSDNTMDGNKDYATVYAKTANGLKAFRVSMAEQKWGIPEFTYTERVSISAQGLPVQHSAQ